MFFIFIVTLAFIFIFIFIFILLFTNTVLGETKEGVKCFNNSIWNRGNNYVSNTYTGIKWECVEFVRRYLILVRGVAFQPVDNALQLTKLTHFFNIYTKLPIPIFHNKNGQCLIEKYDILVIKNNSDFGHTVIVSNVNRNIVEIIEQNYNNNYWKHKHSRQFTLHNGKIVSNVSNETIIDIIKLN